MTLFPYTLRRETWRYWCSNERNWLIALNTFIMASGLLLASASIYLIVVTVIYQIDEQRQVATNSIIYNTLIGLTVVGGFQVFAAIIGIIAADKVSLNLMVVYFWLTTVVVGVMFMFAVVSLDFRYSFKVWLRHHWSDNDLTNPRVQFCREGTAQSLCTVPLTGYPYASEELWCQAKYQASNCAEIRDEALGKTNNLLDLGMGIAGGLALSSVMEMAASLVLTMRVVTVPIIMRSMQTMINYLMILPAVGAFGMGFVLQIYRQMYQSHSYLNDLFYVAGAALICANVGGVVAGHLRHRAWLQGCIVGLLGVLLLYLIICGLCFYISATLNSTFQGYSEAEASGIACLTGMYQCCCCTQDVAGLYGISQCPEWSRIEIADTGQVFVKLGALTSLLSMAFVVCGLVTSLVLLNNLKGYECEYI